MQRDVLNQIDPRVLGMRLQEARKARGVTQQVVADRLGAARTTLVAIEKGERRVTPQELIELVSIYGRTVSEFLQQEPIVEAFVPQFRAALRKDFGESTELDRAATELQSLVEDYVRLERMCGVGLPKSYPPPYDLTGAPPEQAAEEIAASERNRLALGDGPVTDLRLRLETDVGLRIFCFAMPSRVAGLFAYNETLGACVGINAAHPRDRRNWSLAHEYAHFLTTRYRPEATLLGEGKRASARERFADSFARHFLMPSAGLNRRFTEMHRASERGVTLAHLCTLASLYQVSMQALLLCLEELRRLPYGTWERLQAEGFEVRRAQQLLGIEASPPVSTKERLPRRYVVLAMMAHRKGLLSEGQFARLLRLDRVSARALFDETTQSFYTESENGFQAFDLDLAMQVTGKDLK